MRENIRSENIKLSRRTLLKALIALGITGGPGAQRFFTCSSTQENF